MSNDNDNDDDIITTTNSSHGIDFMKWPVIDIFDFEAVSIDATKWEMEDGTHYTAMFNYYRPDDESVEQNTGFTMLTQIDADNLEELYEKVNMMMELGFFNGVMVLAHGTLWDDQGDEIDTICWNNYCDDDDEDEESNSNESHSEPTLNDGAKIPDEVAAASEQFDAKFGNIAGPLSKTVH